MLMFLMKLRLDVMVEDSACWFHMSPGNIFEIFITWVKLMLKQLGVLDIGPQMFSKYVCDYWLYRSAYKNTM